MTDAIRVTAHNSRVGNPDHNDRTFDLDAADHIDQSRCGENLYWTCYCFEPFTHAEREKLLMRDDDYIHRFSAAERMFYQENFTDFIEHRNEKRRKQRNKTTSMEDYINARNTRPEETLFYVGDMNNHAKKEHVQAILQEFFEWHQRRFPLAVFLDWSLHCDERGAPHIHLRKVWTAHDNEGRLYVGQDASLKEMSVEPSGAGKKARYNNRKVTYTKEALEKLQEIAKSHGYTIETTPREKSKSGRSLDEHIAEKKKEEAAEAEARAAAANERAREAEARATTAKAAERRAIASVALLTRQQQERLQAVSSALDKLDATGWTVALKTLDDALKGFTLKPSTTEAKTNAKAARDAVESIADSLQALRAFATSAGETTEQAKAYALMQRRLTRTRNAVARAEKQRRETEEATKRLAAQAEADRAKRWQAFLQEMQRTLDDALSKQQQESDNKEKERAKEHQQKMKDLDKEADRRADERVRERMSKLRDEESSLRTSISTSKSTLTDLQSQIATAQRQITPITTALCAKPSVDELLHAAHVINEAKNTYGSGSSSDERNIVQEIGRAREHRGRNNSYSSPEY